MQMTTRGQYALYAMHDLALHESEGVRTLRAMQETGVPVEYLEQILGMLRRAGLVTTVRGAHGGYRLSRGPGDITVGQILRAAEGPIQFTRCVDDAGNCIGAPTCPARPVWVYLTEQMDRLLDSVTLRDVLEKKKLQISAERV